MLLFPQPGDENAGILGMGPLTGAGRAAAASVEAAPDEAGWTVSVDGARLLISFPAPPEPGAEPSEATGSSEPEEPPTSAAPDPDNRICQVDGEASLADGRRPVSATGVLMAWPELNGGVGSLRAAIAAFGPDDALSLTALRPNGSQGHDHDLLTASVLDLSGATTVEDPRLSTTYASDGSPLRSSLELWVPTGDEAGTEIPRRATGETSGGELDMDTDAFTLRAYAMRWQSRSRTGFGPYLLAQPR